MYEEYLYKQQLLNTMAKDDQLVDTVKVHLRQKIIDKLKSNKPPKPIPTDKTLIKKLSANLFLNYLQQNQLYHTLSVFAPESGFSKHNFSQSELKSLFRVDMDGCDSILEAVLKQVMPKGRLTQKRVDSSAQTDDRQSIQNLQNKLGQIEFQYKQKMAMGLKSVEDNEQRFLKWKNQLNKRYKQDLQREIDRIRNFEIANVRMEQRQKYQIKLKQYQDELDDSYRAKVQKLRERQAEVLQRVTNKMKEVQTINYQSKQKILKDFEYIRAQEEEIEKMKALLSQREKKITMAQSK